MNYSVYELLSIIFFILAGLAAVCAVFYFLRFQIAHVIAVLSGRQAKKQIALWKDSMVAKESITKRISRNDGRDTTSVIYDGEKTTSLLCNSSEEVTNKFCGDIGETGILHDDGGEVTNILDTDSTEPLTSVLEDNPDEVGTMALWKKNHHTVEEKRMIHSAYIISLSGELEPVKNI